MNLLKPHRAEALQRVRTNAFCLLLLIVLSYLLPIPSIFTAFKHAARLGPRFKPWAVVPPQPMRWSAEWAFGWLCTLEAGAVTIFLFNLIQGVYALKYPRTTPPTPSKPLPKGPGSGSPSTPNRHPLKAMKPSPLKGGTVNQFQKPFTFSPVQPSSINPGSVIYPSTPADTPSRGSVKYTFPSALDSTSSASSSSLGTSFPASPTPVLAWRGKHVAAVGKPLDGSFIGQILGNVEDGEE